MIKNRLMKIAAADTIGTALDQFLNGPDGDRLRPGRGRTAKAVMDTMRPYKQVVRITGALFGDRAIDADGVIRLASLPSRETLLSQIAGAFAAPIGDDRRACSTRRCATSSGSSPPWRPSRPPPDPD